MYPVNVMAVFCCHGVCDFSEHREWDSVDTLLDVARSYVQRFAVIILASAEVKIMKGNGCSTFTDSRVDLFH